MNYKGIDGDTLIRMELTFYKMLQRHVAVRDELWTLYSDVCDIIDDINKNEDFDFEYMSEEAQMVPLYMVDKFACDSGHNERLRMFFMEASGKIKGKLEEQYELNVICDILEMEDLDEEDIKLLDSVTNICKGLSQSSVRIVKLVILEIDRCMRDRNSYVGSYELNSAISELIAAYKELNDSRHPILFNFADVKRIATMCICELYDHKPMRDSYDCTR